MAAYLSRYHRALEANKALKFFTAIKNSRVSRGRQAYRSIVRQFPNSLYEH